MRRTYYNPLLSPTSNQNVEDDDYTAGGPLMEPTDIYPANLVSSLCTDGLHRPALDIDIPCRVEQSTTPGHCHLYFDELAMTWEKYQELLQALAIAGIIEHKYVGHSVDRGQTLLRPPGVKADWKLDKTESAF